RAQNGQKRVRQVLQGGFQTSGSAMRSPSVACRDCCGGERKRRLGGRSQARGTRPFRPSNVQTYRFNRQPSSAYQAKNARGRSASSGRFIGPSGRSAYFRLIAVMISHVAPHIKSGTATKSSWNKGSSPCAVVL